MTTSTTIATKTTRIRTKTKITSTTINRATKRRRGTTKGII